MRKILLLSFLFIQTSLFGQTIHAFLLVDSLDRNIHNSTEHDLRGMKSELRRMAKNSHMKIKIYVFCHSNNIFEKSAKKLSKIKTKKSDIIFFYFSGHGCRVPNYDSKWPILLCQKGQKAVPLPLIIKAVRQKKHKLSLIFADCCNTDESSIEEEGARHYRSSHIKKGSVVATASVPNSYAIGTKKGGIFTQFLLHNLHKERSLSKANWRRVLQKTSKYCTQCGQQPQYEVKT